MLVNPLHAAEPVPPVEDSPYLPTSRRYLNPLYIRVTDVPELARPAAAAARPGRGVRRRPVRRRRGPARPPVGVRRQAGRPRPAPRRAAGRPSGERALQEFCRREGPELRQFGIWCALAEHLAGAGVAEPSCATRARPRSRRSPTSSPTGSTSSCGCSGCADEQLAAAQAARPRRRDDDRPGDRPRGRRPPGRRRGLDARARAGARALGRRAARRLQPARAELVAAAVAARRPGRAWATRRTAPCCGPRSGTPAGCGSTT